MGIGGPDYEVNFNSGFLELPQLLELAIIVYNVHIPFFGGEEVVGLDPADSTIFPDPAKKDPAIDLYSCRHP